MSSVIPVILSGGAGTRLWPLSRELMPKQLLKLTGERTLLQETALRLGHPPVVVCNHEHRFIVAEQLREVGLEPRAVVIEPVGRNTAPAAAVAALMLADADPDALMLLMPSDHLIVDTEAFRRAVEAAVPLAQGGRLVTFGIQPTGPNTGYGYIKAGRPLGDGFEVERFVEKPDLATAQSYLASGEYTWNSGIFLLPVGLFLSELETHAPGMADTCRAALAKGRSDLFFFRLDDETFAGLKGQSIDYAVMEHSTQVAVVPVDMGWSDIGSWSALWQESTRDASGNVIKGDVLAIDSSDCYLRSHDHLVATVGVHDLVVIATDDAVLVADKSRDQEVKAVVEALKREGRPEATQGSRGWRPWGWFQTIEQGERFKVKHIHVDPGAKLSLQKHWHRSEHWVVVRGTAVVTCGDTSFVLRENESTFIPAGTPHRLENPGKVPLRLIEVQSGEYVGEDDIVRLEDAYGR
ncbi:mannose-1-phosphate guanylyltransferase/mannose-6-phosphate isomerase [Paramagnetospirillum marisnigri]|uniref:mannose-1-phosphate guanylyltransferase n=1 Tax=Paramagnetospirillum marisnigri TaxID=1285242 RepID=A0A178MNT4_9PROT|nr:mannose-1-phosphate guanylyltransferase/mannose-6-phosphate isomerase [Paramagnetospirillum marisnigri]OAN50289.1 mannose-1-phosphate guanylyltransferase/mannose-6-phosphate isomerase [Paramagnetospirillum marisnigri]